MEEIKLFKNLGNDLSLPLGRNTIDQACKRICNREESINKFVPHDLRRTWRTLSSKVGVDPHIAERCIGHHKRRFIKLTIHGHMDERKEAMKKVANHIDSYIYTEEDIA